MTRVQTIRALIEARGYRRYLEIGCSDDACFSQIFNIEKVGVDPVQGGTHRMTSDVFFAKHHGAKFDLVFIDGDHRHAQVMRDVENALSVLSPDGCIVMHDCLPPDQQHEDPGACGTAWRAFAKLRTRADLDCVCGDYDYGVGIVQRRANRDLIEISQSMDQMTYQQFKENRARWMRPISFEAVQELASTKPMFHKYEIAAALGRRLGLRSYLEIATPTTGYEFSCVDPGQFPVRERAMYYCPADWSDGVAVDYRASDATSRSLSFPAGKKFDLVFVDAWHELPNASEDLGLALDLVAPKGVVLLHDCNPESEEKARPKLPAECAPGHCDRPWSGETYAAFLDRVLGSDNYVTVDDDHGCGIILPGGAIVGARPSDALIGKWWSLKEPTERFAFFSAYRAELLRLRTPQQFLEMTLA